MVSLCCEIFVIAIAWNTFVIFFKFRYDLIDIVCSEQRYSSKNESIQSFNPLMQAISNSNTLSEHLSYQFEKKIHFCTFVRYIVLSNYLPISQEYGNMILQKVLQVYVIFELSKKCQKEKEVRPWVQLKNLGWARNKLDLIKFRALNA